MVRRSPAEAYLKYLIVHPDGFSDTQIRDLVRLQQLDFLGMPHLKFMRQTCVPPSPFYPENRNHHRSYNFITLERIWDMFHQDDDVRAANNVLETPRAKEMLESMLITRMAPEYISAVLARDGCMRMTPRAVERYKHYFFNVDLVDATELRALLATRTVRWETKDPDEQALQGAAKRFASRDPRAILAGMTSTPLAAVMNSIRWGFVPQGLDISRLAANVRAAAVIRSGEATFNNNSTAARDFAIVSQSMHELMGNVGDPSGGLQSDLTKMLLETEQAQIPSLQSLRDATPQVVEAPQLEMHNEPTTR